jgi:hypothetical protein
MKGMVLRTPETLRQLDYDLWRAIRRLAKARTRYFRKGKTDRVELQGEVLNLFGYLYGKMKQMTVKMVDYSRNDAIAIANEALKNPRKSQENISKLLRLDQILKELQDDAGNEKRMSSIIGNLATGTRKQINPIINNTQAKIAQLVKREQQVQKARAAQQSKQPKRKLIPRFGFGRA